MFLSRNKKNNNVKPNLLYKSEVEGGRNYKVCLPDANVSCCTAIYKSSFLLTTVRDRTALPGLMVFSAEAEASVESILRLVTFVRSRD